jgi:hypothetical protein
MVLTRIFAISLLLITPMSAEAGASTSGLSDDPEVVCATACQAISTLCLIGTLAYCTIASRYKGVVELSPSFPEYNDGEAYGGNDAGGAKPRSLDEPVEPRRQHDGF